MPLIGNETLFQASAKRLSGGADTLQFTSPLVLTNSDFWFIVTEQLQEVGIDPGAILIEPDGHNTAPAILAAVLLVAPSDHVVPDSAAFHAAMERGMSAITAGKLVTFGITPTYAEAAYGYLELADTEAGDAPVPLKRFVEKPDASRAAAILASGNFKWNAGIFLFRAAEIVDAFRNHAPNLEEPVRQSVEKAEVDLGFLRLDPVYWAIVEDISIDYAVMERAGNLAVVPFDTAWSDLGGWDAVWRESGPDAEGVVSGDGTTAIDCRDTLLRSDSDRMEVVGIGLDNIMAVAKNDAVLVADMLRAQDVKKAVAALEEQKAS